MNPILTAQKLKKFELYLKGEEKSSATIEKYMRDVKHFSSFAKGREIKRALMLDYKSYLSSAFAPTSANSMIAALNSFLHFCGKHELCIKQLRIQKEVYRSEEKELSRSEYLRLTDAARLSGNEKISLIIQTICASGIRVSELKYITVEAVRRAEAFVSCKGKNRRIFIVAQLRKKLLKYVEANKIKSGPVFVNKNGAPVSRHYIWRSMKSLCGDAGICKEKVFPHNLRHLFARTFYGIEKDIAKLADILGHSSINTTRIYIITTGAEHRRKMENMRLII